MSCTSPKFCEAVGTLGDDAGFFSVAETWNGTVWSGLTDFHQTSLTAVSCTSSTNCVAAGYSFPPERSDKALLWRAGAAPRGRKPPPLTVERARTRSTAFRARAPPPAKRSAISTTRQSRQTRPSLSKDRRHNLRLAPDHERRKLGLGRSRASSSADRNCDRFACAGVVKPDDDVSRAIGLVRPFVTGVGCGRLRVRLV